MKPLATTLPLLVAALPSALLAQPIITASKLSYLPGEIYQNSYCDSISPGSAGANQTWSFDPLSGCSTGSAESWQAPSSGSTITYDVSQRFGAMSPSSYFTSSADAFRLVFGAPIVNDTYNYSDHKDMFRFPFAYGDSFTDSFAGTRTYGAGQETFQGTRTVTYDAYGTITVPGWGTFTDVIRLHVHEVIEHSVSTFMNRTSDDYLFIRPGVHKPVLRINFYTSQGNGVLYGSSNLHTAPTNGVDDLNETALFDLFPNPANGVVTVRASFSHAGLAITSLDGRTIPIATTQQTPGSIQFDAGALAAGVYLAILSSADGSVFQRFVKE